MKESELKRFFAKKEGEPHRVRMDFKRFSFRSLPNKLQVNIKKRLAEKDEIIALGLKGILPGIKIDGKVITKDNIKEFERDKMSEPKIKKVIEEKVPEIKEEPKKESEDKIKYTRKELEKLSLKELKKIGKPLGETDRSKKKLIEEILKHY